MKLKAYKKHWSHNSETAVERKKKKIVKNYLSRDDLIYFVKYILQQQKEKSLVF